MDERLGPARGQVLGAGENCLDAAQRLPQGGRKLSEPVAGAFDAEGHVRAAVGVDGQPPGRIGNGERPGCMEHT